MSDASGSLSGVHLTFTGDDTLTVRNGDISMEGDAGNVLTVAKDAMVNLEKGRVAVGQSSGNNGSVVIAGTLNIKNEGDETVRTGQVEIGNTGTLNVTGSTGMFLGGMTAESGATFNNTFVVKEGGTFISNCGGNAIVIAGRSDADWPDEPEKVINLPEGYLGEGIVVGWVDDGDVGKYCSIGVIGEITYSDGSLQTGLEGWPIEISSTPKPPYPVRIDSTDIELAEKTYDGNTNGTVEQIIFKFAEEDENSPFLPDEPKKDKDYTATAVFTDPNAGKDKEVIVTVTLNSSYYTFENGEKTKEYEVTGVIKKAEAPKAKNDTMEVANQYAGTYTFDVSKLLPELPDASKTFGEVTYQLGEISLGGYYTDDATINEGILSLPINKVDSDKQEEIGTVQVKISSTNYEDMTATITVKSTNQKTREVTISDKPDSVTYGNTFTLTAQVSPVGDSTVKWEANGAAKVDEHGNVTITGAGEFTITATVPADATYAEATDTWPGTASPKDLTITAEDKTIQVGNELPELTYTADGLVNGDTLTGVTWTYQNESGEEVTNPSTAGTYKIVPSGGTFEPAAAVNNYEIQYVNGTLTITDKPVYQVTVEGGTSDKMGYTAGEIVTITADDPKEGMEFDKWTSEDDEVVFTDATASETTFIMPEKNVKVTANFEDVETPDPAPEEHSVTVVNGTITESGETNGKYQAGDTVSITANDPEEGMKFVGWSSDGGVTFTNSKESTTTFTMPDHDVTVTANFETVEDPDPEPPVYHDSSNDSGITDYAIELEDTAHGSVEVSDTRASRNTIITLTVTPDEGYMLDVLNVIERNGLIRVTDKGDGRYTFSMPSSKVTIFATFVQQPQPVQPVQPVLTYANCTHDAQCPLAAFTDVNMQGWYHNGIHYCLDEGLMSGTSATTFSPDTPTTRGMIVTVLARLDGVNTSGGSTWYEAAQKWAMANGISDGTGMEDNLTREQLAAMLYRYAQYKGYDTTQGGMSIREFGDYAQISDYAMEALTWAINSGLMSGMDDGTLNPQGQATRAQIATIFLQLAQKIA